VTSEGNASPSATWPSRDLSRGDSAAILTPHGGVVAGFSVTKVTARPCRFAAAMLTVLLLAFAATPVSAQAVDCATVETQAALNRCAREESDRATRRLSDLVQELRRVTDPDRMRGLDSAQASWDGYRRVQCVWEASAYEGGSMKPMVLSACWTRVTELRIAELKVLLCEGGAPACYDPPRPAGRRP
jgi:uncharacterized protein YecT (DUF1311 family)